MSRLPMAWPSAIAACCAVLSVAGTLPAQSDTPAPGAPRPPAPVERVDGESLPPITRVNVTYQRFDFVRPWEKDPPGSRSGIGAILPGGRVLVSAELLADHSFIELERPDSGEKQPANVLAVDYSVNLALIEPTNAAFLDPFDSFELIDQATVGDRFEAWQLESNGSILRTDALLTSVQVLPYPMGDLALLLFQLTSALQSRDGSFTIPLVLDGRLSGVIMRYDARSQNMAAIPAEVIRHFLEDVDDGHYNGFPKAGIAFNPTRDPQLRTFLGLPEDVGGVYVNEVGTGQPGALAGIREGDVLVEVDGHPIDRDGNYEDPVYGRLSLANIVSLGAHAGDSLPFVVLRDGKRQSFDVTVQPRPPTDYVSPPYLIDTPPSFLIAGGLVFQELSRQYLKEWGKSWQRRADSKLVYYDRYQGTLFPDEDRRIVFLSQVLPTPTTIGYKDLDHLVVTTVNNRPIRSLHDLGAALESPVDGFHRIEFEDSPRLIFLDPDSVATTNEALRSIYGLPATERLPDTGR